MTQFFTGSGLMRLSLLPLPPLWLTPATFRLAARNLFQLVRRNRPSSSSSAGSGRSHSRRSTRVVGDVIGDDNTAVVRWTCQVSAWVLMISTANSKRTSRLISSSYWKHIDVALKLDNKLFLPATCRRRSQCKSWWYYWWVVTASCPNLLHWLVVTASQSFTSHVWKWRWGDWNGTVPWFPFLCFLERFPLARCHCSSWWLSNS